MQDHKDKLEADIVLNFHNSKRQDRLTVLSCPSAYNCSHFRLIVFVNHYKNFHKISYTVDGKFCEMKIKTALRLVLLEWRLTLGVSTKLKGTSWYTLQGVKRAALPLRGLPWTSVLKCGDLASPRGTAEFISVIYVTVLQPTHQF